MLPRFALFAVSLLLSIPQAMYEASTKLLNPRDPCDDFCTPIADVDPTEPNSHICTNSVILQYAQCDDCEGSLSLLSHTDNYGELQDDVDSFVDSCNIAGFKVKNVTVKGSSDLPPGSQSAESAAVTHAAGMRGASLLLTVILVALGSAAF